MEFEILNNNTYLVMIPFCWTAGYGIGYLGSTYAVISLLPLSVIFITTLNLIITNRFKSYLSIICIKAVWLWCYILQRALKVSRPQPRCVPFIMTQYGFPNCEVVYSISILTQITYVVTKEKSYSRYWSSFIFLLTSSIYIFGYYCASLASIGQILISFFIGLMSTLFICFTIDLLIQDEIKMRYIYNMLFYHSNLKKK